MFYNYDQNNSGGGFDVDDSRGIGHIVIIEAKDSNEADEKAKRIGIYFNGVDKGEDCECCGDRWYSAYADCATAGPTLSGKPITEWVSKGFFDDVAFVHYADGKIEKYPTKKE